jgi:glucosyl-3-phosphoglycerate synthase
MVGIDTFRLDRPALEVVRAAKGDQAVSLCIPCRDEAATIGRLVGLVRHHLMGPDGVVDELIVIDDGSSDGSGWEAAQAGARVVAIDDVHAAQGPGQGKGNALWASLLVSLGDIVVWCDGDVTSFEPDWVPRLAAPLLVDPTIGLVKASYRRPTDTGGGGRTTELVARPLLSLYHPELAHLDQPLAGEYAVRASMAAQIPFVQGWGVEIAMLIDVADRFGPEAITQVDLGLREHRHRPLAALSVQAAEVMATLLARSGEGKWLDDDLRLTLADGTSQLLNLAERPPLAGLGPSPGNHGEGRFARATLAIDKTPNLSPRPPPAEDR